MRVALYARVSTTDQTCEQQLTALREYCAARGWGETSEYVDTGYSGAKAKRPALDRLMHDAGARKLDCIVVWKLDRWARSTTHLFSSLAALESAGVRWIATTQGIDTDQSNPVGRLLTGLLGLIAEFERALIVERVNAGIARARREGKRLGRPRAVIDRVRCVELRAQGLSLAQIARETGGTVATVHRIVGKATGSRTA